jgi:hypothetical protein
MNTITPKQVESMGDHYVLFFSTYACIKEVIVSRILREGVLIYFSLV